MLNCTKVELGLVDKVIPEPVGGAHRDLAAMSATLKRNLNESLRVLKRMSVEELLENRHRKLMNFGSFSEQG